MTITQDFLPGLEPPSVVLAQARARRRATRDALDGGAAAERRHIIAGWIDDALQQLDRVIDRYQATTGEWRIEYGRQADTLRTRIQRYQSVLDGQPQYPSYVPPGDYAWDDENQTQVHVDLLAPDFDPIDRAALSETTLHQLDRTVSDMRNWAYEMTDVAVRRAVHQAVALDKVALSRSFETKTWHQDRTLAPVTTRHTRVKLSKPSYSRHYLGFHPIGPEWITDPDTGRKRRRTAEEQVWIPRKAVITVWLARRNRWAVYVADDGGRPDGRFTNWMPYEWHLIDPWLSPTYLGPGTDQDDVQYHSLELALTVAYQKHAELAREMGEVTDPVDPLPFDPDTLGRIIDARAADVEHRRRTAERDSE